MIATLEYNLPDEKSEFLSAANAQDLECALYELSRQVRTWVKHDGRGSIPIDEISRAFFEVVQDLHIEL